MDKFEYKSGDPDMIDESEVADTEEIFESITAIGEKKEQRKKEAMKASQKKSKKGRSIIIEAFLLIVGILGLLLGFSQKDKTLTLVGVVLIIMMILFLVADIAAKKRREKDK